MTADPGRREFPTTRWHLVLSARSDTEESQEALADLCGIYWYPLYAFVRRQGYSPEDAQDLTQGFFARLLEKHYLQDFQRERGRFRSFLLASLKHFLANERDWGRAKKRGGGILPVSLSEMLSAGESRYNAQPRHDTTPEQIFEKQWVQALLDHVLVRLEAEFEEAGKGAQFDRFKGFLTDDAPDVRYRQLAEDFAMSEGALKVAIHRMRRRFRELLRESIAQTVASPDEVREELRYLLKTVAGA